MKFVSISAIALHLLPLNGIIKHINSHVLSVSSTTYLLPTLLASHSDYALMA